MLLNIESIKACLKARPNEALSNKYPEYYTNSKSLKKSNKKYLPTGSKTSYLVVFVTFNFIACS